MRRQIENWLNETWYGESAPPGWLRMLVPVYKALLQLDKWRKIRQRRTMPDGSCIVVAGNLTAGGSGKTPLVIRLCGIIREAGLKPGIVSRGYGRETRGLRLVSPGASAAEVGDEALLIARRTGLPVLVAEDRAAAAATLLKKGCNVIVSDDGLQHHLLYRDIEICVIDGSRGFGNGMLLPAGPLREPLQRLGSVDHVVINGAMAALPGAEDLQQIVTHRMDMVAGLLRSLDEDESWRLSQYSGCKVNAVAGIGNPDRFFELLRHAGIKLIEHRFPDHHAYGIDDFANMAPDLPIIMTEKDAVKCTGLGLSNAWYLSVNAVLPAEWEQQLIRQVYTRIEQARNGAR